MVFDQPKNRGDRGAYSFVALNFQCQSADGDKMFCVMQAHLSFAYGSNNAH